MRRAALFSLIASSALATLFSRPASADCSAPTAPCVDAEPWWLSASAKQLLGVSDTAAPSSGRLELALTDTLRARPAILTVPAPNVDGRDVELVGFALDSTLSGRIGLAQNLELTSLVPVGVLQDGAGIKGVTYQSAPAISRVSLHDPRVGFGYSLPLRTPSFGAKLRFEAKLPLGSAETLSGERSFVASPSLALSVTRDGFFAGAELGARLRRKTEFFGLNLGSQGQLSAGAGYQLARPRLSFALELYCAQSLIPSGSSNYLAAEWLASVRFAPRESALSVGLGGGSGLPVSGNSAGSSFAFGVPAARFVAFLRFATKPDD